jgi:nucleotide-binding universal stress UspA family protein
MKEECGMRLLCAVGLSDGALVMREALALVRDSVEVIALHVIDEQPRRDAESPRGPLRHISPERQRELGQVEEEAGSATLAEAVAAARDAGAQVTSLVTRLERGRPEQVIVAQARELGADLIALRPREHPESIPPIGPPSIGHTARYVVDHAPCPVLLLRIATH